MEMGKMSSIITVRSIMLVLIIFYGSVGAISPRSFDFFLFVQQWPATYYHLLKNGSEFCYPNKTERLSDLSDFSIHGLWPSYENGTGPESCSSSPKFNFSQVSHLEEELCKYWPSFKNASRNDSTCANQCGNKGFWAHEWKKHGTCCYSELRDQLWYFNTTLSLRKRISLLSALQAKGIRPNGYKKYNLTSIRNAIKESTGKFPGVSCKKRRLFEVHVCVNKSDASTVITCPSYPRDNCTTTVVFPPFPSSLEENALDGTDEL